MNYRSHVLTYLDWRQGAVPCGCTCLCFRPSDPGHVQLAAPVTLWL